MKKALCIAMILVFTLSLFGCAQQAAQAPKELTICAAASLNEALTEIQPLFEKEKNIKLTYNFGSSGTLQKQIEEGAPADLFISAGKKQMDALEGKDLIVKESRKNLLGNKLVMIVPMEYKDQIKSANDLTTLDQKLSIGETETVPAGQYAKSTLTNLNLWDQLSGKVVYGKDVKQVVAYVEAGEVAAGIVYNSDATVIKNSVIAQVFEDSTHDPIIYPAAIVTASKEQEAAKVFFDYLQSDKAKKIFEKYGFDVNVK